MHRRFICLIAVIFVFISLAACSKKKTTEQPVTVGFSCDVDVQYKDMNVKGHLTRTSAGSLRMDITEPKTISGLSMQWNGNVIKLKLHGFSFDVDPESIPQSALGKCILGVLDAALGIRDQGKLTDKGLITKGMSPSGEFEIISDPKTGNILQISVPSAEITAKLSNLSLSKT